MTNNTICLGCTRPENEGWAHICGPTAPVAPTTAPTEETIRCIHDGACGINLPKHFVDDVGHEALIDRGAVEADLMTVSEGPDGEFFWDAWAAILDAVSFTADGHTWTLHQDGDLFEVRDDHDWEDGWL